MEAGILEPIPRRFRPTRSARLKAVPDRKRPEQGRLIYPAIKLNDACSKPDPTPLPRIPALIRDILGKEWGWTCDIRSWFYHFEVHPDIAAKYFATRDKNGRQYAHVRAAMGWKWMPYIACSTANYVLSRCLKGNGSHGAVWIDDVICASSSRDEAIQTRKRFLDECVKYSIETRDASDVTQLVTAVGTEMDLKTKSWRLTPKWVSKATSLWEQLDTKRQVPADALWGVAGQIAWAAYAGGHPMCVCLDAIRYACRKGVESLDVGKPKAMIPLPRRVRDELRTFMVTVAQNTWRRHAIAPPEGNAIVTDASRSGFGAMFPTAHGTVERSEKVPNALSERHINILEAEAVVGTVKHLKPGSYWAITDNTTVYYNLCTGLGASSLLPTLNRLRQALIAGKVNLFPLWMSTENMAAIGADELSRRGLNMMKTTTSTRKLLECVKRAKRDTMELDPAGAAPIVDVATGSRLTVSSRKDWIHAWKSAQERAASIWGPK